MDNPQRSFKLFEKRSETKQLWALISLRYSPTPRETLGIVTGISGKFQVTTRLRSLDLSWVPTVGCLTYVD